MCFVPYLSAIPLFSRFPPTWSLAKRRSPAAISCACVPPTFQIYMRVRKYSALFAFRGFFPLSSQVRAGCKQNVKCNSVSTHIFHPLSGVCNDVERKESLECKSSTSAALLNLSCCKLCLRVKFSLLVTRVNELQIRLRGIFICLSKSLLKAFSLFCWCFYVFLPYSQIWNCWISHDTVPVSLCEEYTRWSPENYKDWSMNRAHHLQVVRQVFTPLHYAIRGRK